MVLLNIALERAEAQAVERLLSVLLEKYADDLSAVALGGTERVRQRLAVAIKADTLRHYAAKYEAKAAA